MLTKKDISRFRTELENTKYGEDFMTEFLKKERRRRRSAGKKTYGRRETGAAVNNPQGV